MNHYLQVLIECAWAASVVPLGSDTTIYAMHAFGTFNMQQALMMAILGAGLGQCFNYALGRVLLHLKQKENWPVPEKGYQKAKATFEKYGIFLLLFCWVTLGNFLVVIAGFLGVRARIALPLVVVGTAAHYMLAIS